MYRKFQLFYLLAICVLTSFNASAQAEKPSKPPVAQRQFTREEFMVLNLNRGADSSGSHLSDSLKLTKQMIKDLDKSLRQLQQADREFAKSKGRPDDHFLTPAATRLEESLKTAQKLAEELEASRAELKDSIHQALIMGQ